MKRVVTLFVAAAIVWGHHGSNGFDQNRPLHFTGTVTQVEWSNPHVVLHVDAGGVTWQVNTLPPNTAKRLGFSQGDFTSGVEVTVDGFQALDGSNHVNGTSIVLKNGKQITSAACFAPSDHCFGQR